VIPLYEAAQFLQHFCEERAWPHCFIGGLAVQRWGEPRYTQDADLTLFTDFIHDEEYTDALLAVLLPRRSDAREFALRHRVILARHANGVSLDIGLGGLPFEAASISRSSLWHAAEGCHLRTCSAEDLIVHKAFAGRDLDWLDVTRILQRQGRNLDLPFIERELAPLLDLKEEPQNLERLRQMIARYSV